jgi:thioredoxin reductase (NADPH)
LNTLYDVIIIGGGPAGLSAAIYAGRAELSVLLLEKASEGGQIALASSVDNYPGGLPGESGQELIGRMAEQARHFGVRFASENAKGLRLSDEAAKVVETERGEFSGKALIIASGNAPRRLGVPGEAEYVGRGVSYCAVCDGPFFSGMEIFVAGGGDSAVEEADYLTRFARKVTLIHRRDSLRAAKSIQEKAMSNEKMSFLWNSVIKEIRGGDFLNALVVEDVKTGEQRVIHADEKDGMAGLFVFVGHSPNTDFLPGEAATEGGYIITDEDMRTGLPGVFAAGDVRRKSLRQVVTAVADGAIAAAQAQRYIETR